MFSGSIVALITPFKPDGEVDSMVCKSWLSITLRRVLTVLLR